MNTIRRKALVTTVADYKGQQFNNMRFDIHEVLRVSSSVVYRGPRFMYSLPIFKEKTIINDCVSNFCAGAEVS
jgi:hypothetical protein